MKTTFDLPDTLLRRAKAIAAEQGRPLRDLVAEAISEKLKAPSAGGGKRPIGYTEGRRLSWEEWSAKLEKLPDGTWFNPEGIQDESYFETLEAIRHEPRGRRNPFADQD
jgi:hypothetical protein